MRRLAALLLGCLMLAACGAAPSQRPAIRGARQLARLGGRLGTVQTPVVGEVLSATTGAWSNTPTSYAYQWQDCTGGACTNISAATSSSYTVVPGDVGDTIQVIVTAFNAGLGSATQTSAPTGVVAASFTCPGGVRCFYIAATGSDANTVAQAQSESTPWAHAPTMQTFTGTYAHQAGDEFIFKGGDTWGNANFPMYTGTGTAAHPDYYGVDPSWFTGASWTQPTFDAGSADICPSGCTDPIAPGGTTGRFDVFVDMNDQDYVTLDDIHFTGYSAMASASYHACDELLPDDTTGTATHDNHILMNRLVFEVPQIGRAADTSLGADVAGDCSVIRGNANTSTLENSTIKGDSATWGRGVFNLGSMVNNTVYGMGAGLLYPNGGGVVSGNNLYGCAANPTTGVAQDPSDGGTPTVTIHNNAIETLGAAQTGIDYIHDNVIYFTGATADNECESLIIGNTGETDYVWNNVFYSLGGNGPTYPQSGTLVGPAAYYWNNSVASDNLDSVCLRFSTSPATLFVQNNLCVGAGGISGTGTLDHNVTLTAATASSDGYTGTSGPFVWMPPSGASPTNGTGANLTADCTANVTLCSDTTYAGGRTALSRPNVGSWDVGAYEFH